MNQEYFAQLCRDLSPGEKTSPDAPGEIGILAEKSMHRVIKSYLEVRPECQEIKVGRYFADIKNEAGIMEVQTRQLFRLKKKLEVFLPEYPVRVVVPLAFKKYVSWIDLETGEISGRRKSPKKESFYTLTKDLYSLREFLHHPNFSLELFVVEAEEFRYLNGWSRDKKRGSVRCDRVPLSLLDEILLTSPEDYSRFLPEDLPESFTAKELAALLRIPKGYEWYTAALFSELGLLSHSGKRGRSSLYSRIE